MIQDALTNPPLPEWNNLTNDQRATLCDAWEYSSCPHSCGGDPVHFYGKLREVLLAREREIFKMTMAG